ncbi:uncharacterized protein [Drosophila pseudoobscura]|uniref:Uncharacterized protein n=1 Tax=Drosophila pseudoobscura pseudoobscura TaxID=46245 RepID=B5DPF6_DROPS|nr:uncharacterized protein LOC6900520 [Drosophila pseudoobscura]
MSSGQEATLPEDLGRHLERLRRTKRELVDEVKVLHKRVLKIENCLELLEGRTDDLPCTFCRGLVYQQSTVRALREGLSASLAVNGDLYSGAHGRLMSLHEQIRLAEGASNQNNRRFGAPEG